MSIVIGGGTGFIGHHVSKLASSKGYKVVSVSRKSAPNCMTWADVTRSGLPEDCVAVVSMSGEKIIQPFKRWTEAQKARLRESRIDKTQLLNRAICQAQKPPKAFVSFSGVGYYKPDETKEYTEEDVIEPFDFISRLSQDWENAAKLPSTLLTRTVIIRSGVVLGKDGGVIQNLKMPFYLGLGGPIGSGKQWFPWIHVEDMAGIVMHAIENDDVSGILNGTSPLPVKNGEFTKAYASALCRPHLLPMPAFVTKGVFGSEEAVLMLEGQKVLPERTMASGYHFKYPDVVSACKEIVS